MGCPVAKQNVEADKRVALIYLWTHAGWHDRREIGVGVHVGRSMQIALQQLTAEGRIRALRGPHNLFLYTAEMPSGTVEWEPNDGQEAEGSVVCPHCAYHGAKPEAPEPDHILTEGGFSGWRVSGVERKESNHAAVGDEAVGYANYLKVTHPDDERGGGDSWIECGKCHLPFALPDEVHSVDYDSTR